MDDDALALRLSAAMKDYARIVGDYQEVSARLILAIEAAVSIAEQEATRLMVADHAAGRGLDGCCVLTAQRIADAIRTADKADSRARRIAAQRTAEAERNRALALLQRFVDERRGSGLICCVRDEDGGHDPGCLVGEARGVLDAARARGGDGWMPSMREEAAA